MRTLACAVLLLSALLAGCGDESPHIRSSTTTANGLTVELPAGWQAARESLTPHLTDPREQLAVGTYPLRYRETECAHVPGSALEDLGPTDAFVELEERGTGVEASEFPNRPEHFGPQLGGRSEANGCVPSARFEDHWFTFSDAGRRFHVRVAFGPDAPAETQRQAWAILDGLQVDPSVLPTWRSAG
jgi:hypothetical protein